MDMEIFKTKAELVAAQAEQDKQSKEHRIKWEKDFFLKDFRVKKTNNDGFVVYSSPGASPVTRAFTTQPELLVFLTEMLKEPE